MAKKINKDQRIVDIKDESLVQYSINAFLSEYDEPIIKEDKSGVSLDELFRVAHVIRSLGMGTHPLKGIATHLHSYEDIQGGFDKSIQHSFSISFGDLTVFHYAGTTPQYAMLMCMGHYCKNLLLALKRDENKKSK